ncbi:hypothetical protein WA577_001162 [Blastocystis sp. JDR]
MSNNDIELETIHTTANPEPPSNPTTPIESKVDAKVSGDENKSSTPVEIPEESDGTLTANELAINLMKCIAGTGALAIPYGIWSVGIILGVISFFVVAVLYILSAYQLIVCYNHTKSYKTTVKTNNDYARLCFITLKNPGYVIFNIANVVTLYGMAMGTMIVMTDFLDSLPIPASNHTLKRALLQALITIIGLIFCLLKDPSLLVAISSFGLAALIISLVILFFYGVVHFGFKFDSSFWFPRPKSILNNLGVFLNALAFSLMCLSQAKHVKKAYQKRITKTISVSVVIMAIIYIIIGLVFLSLYKTDNGVPGNILAALPSSSIWNTIISVLMVITCMGSFPLYLGPVHELFDGRCGKVKTNRFFITNPQYVSYRVVEVCGLSVLAFIFNDFKAVLNFIGSSTAVLVNCILPALIHFYLLKKKLSFTWKCVDWIVIVLTSILMVICTIVSFKELVHSI